MIYHLMGVKKGGSTALIKLESMLLTHHLAL